MMIQSGMRFFNKTSNIDFLVCHLSSNGIFCATYDLNINKDKLSFMKPEKHLVSSIAQMIRSRSLEHIRYTYPTILTQSDPWIVKELGKQKWIEKRDKKVAELHSLTCPTLIEQYLYGKGLGDEIQLLIPHSRWNHKDQYYRELNRFIFFLLNENAFLPFAFNNCGKNYRHVVDETDTPTKRGRGGKNNQYSRSKSRGITLKDKKNIKKVAAYIKRNSLKLQVTHAYRFYSKSFERLEVERKIYGKTQWVSYVFKEEERISFEQFYYHFNKVINRSDLLKMKVGNLAYAKDHEDKQGSARDGVRFATHRYEVDATVLDCYVRYPYDNTKNLTMGRPVLYLVVCVYSTMITGMYLGFDGPNWAGASQALANACLDKVEFARKYGLELGQDDWPAKHIPCQITVDNGNEYPDKLVESILMSEIGVELFNFVAVYRGDAKGVVERKFGVLNNQKIHFIPGAIAEAPRREDSHPSNDTLYDYESLVALLITEIIYHNQSAERLKLCNFSAIVNKIDITPQSIFLHSLSESAGGGNVTSVEDEARVSWAFRPEEQATVRSSHVYFKGVEYHHDYFKESGQYNKARHHGTFKIIVKCINDWINHIWHKTDDGHYIKLTIKNINNENPLVDQHWETALHVLEQMKDIKHENKQNSYLTRAYWDSVMDPITTNNQKQKDLAPKNQRKSIQPGIKVRQAIQKQLLVVQEKVKLDELLASSSDTEQSQVTHMEDLDNELYGD